MPGLTVALLLAVAVGAWQFGGTFPGREAVSARRIPSGTPQPPADNRFRRARSRDAQAEGEVYALLVRELAGLLVAGRSAHRIWADAAALHDPGGPGVQGSTLAPVLQAAAAATSLGMSPVPVLAAAAAGGAGGSGVGGDRSPGGNPAGRELWAGLAVCVQVSERSGAPLSGVLTRYAGQLDDARDAAADRETALAGPRATVRLLTWLPVGGMVLGYLLGGNPLQVLAGTPAGWAAAVAGCGFWLAGRIWSGRLVRDAAVWPESR